MAGIPEHAWGLDHRPWAARRGAEQRAAWPLVPWLREAGRLSFVASESRHAGERAGRSELARPVSPRPTGKHRRAPTVPTLPRTPQTLTSWGRPWDDTTSSGGRGSNALRPTQLSRPQAEKGHGAQGPRNGRAFSPAPLTATPESGTALRPGLGPSFLQPREPKEPPAPHLPAGLGGHAAAQVHPECPGRPEGRPEHHAGAADPAGEDVQCPSAPDAPA